MRRTGVRSARWLAEEPDLVAQSKTPKAKKRPEKKNNSTFQLHVGMVSIQPSPCIFDGSSGLMHVDLGLRACSAYIPKSEGRRNSPV